MSICRKCGQDVRYQFNKLTRKSDAYNLDWSKHKCSGNGYKAVRRIKDDLEQGFNRAIDDSDGDVA